MTIPLVEPTEAEDAPVVMLQVPPATVLNRVISEPVHTDVLPVIGLTVGTVIIVSYAVA